tara:strand:+ start:218 stop:1309 length:1092 start_codon:yes stop_codon:yes gene_type:complete
MKKSVHSFFASDPLLKKLLDANQVKRSGGSSIKLTRIKSGHSDLVEISSTNIQVPLVKQETFGSLTGDWGRYIKPMIIPHVDRDRAADPAEAKRLVQDTVAAVMTDAKNRVMRQIYIGNEAGLKALGSLNGGRDNNASTGNIVGGFSTGTSTGLENGALVFDSPTLQAASGVTYLGQARLEDTTNFTDHWHNQFGDADIGTEFVEQLETVKLLADSYSDDPNGITLGICSNASLVNIGAEARAYPGGAGTSASAMVYTTDDVDKGRVHRPLSVIAGVAFYGNRFMTDALMDSSAAGTKHTEHVYLLNPSGIEWWVNANNNFRTTEFYDGLKTSNVDADIAYCILECQFVVTNLMIQGCTANAN